jgi:hypothetical protein
MLEQINHFELLPKRLRKWTMKIKWKKGLTYMVLYAYI